MTVIGNDVTGTDVAIDEYLRTLAATETAVEMQHGGIFVAFQQAHEGAVRAAIGNVPGIKSVDYAYDANGKAKTDMLFVMAAMDADPAEAMNAIRGVSGVEKVEPFMK